MPLSSVVGAQSIVRPGVCTSSTRPASPYDGQVIYETDTDKTLVWNGSGWVYLSTSTANPVGLELVVGVGCSSGGTASNGVVTIGSAVASTTVTNAFSSTYDNYRIIVNGTVGNQAGNFTLQLSGITGSNYYLGGTFFNYANTTVNGYGPALATTWNAIGPLGTSYSSLVVDITNPYSSDEKVVFAQGSSTLAYYSFGGSCTSTASATGFVLAHNITSMTGGTIRVYGYKN